jgi:NADH:ubiquinone oxidoreductase subunit 5 (subunit L)/multisubunit Na+/H+ antiporter MnhA subunit
MTIPLILLAIPSVIAGYWFGFFSYIKPGVPGLDFLTIVSDWKTWLGVVVALVGFAWAYTLYTRFEFARITAYVQSHAVLRVLHRILLRKYYVDEFYDLLVRYVVLGLSHIEQAFDAYVVDGLVNGTAQFVLTLGRDVRHIETGRVQTYMVGIFGGVAVLAAVVFVLVTVVK